MNQTNLRRLIGHLRSTPPSLFDMDQYVVAPDIITVGDIKPEYRCGTAGCIAGHVALAFQEELDQELDVHSAAAEWLGLDPIGASYLFFGKWSGKPLKHITLNEAIEQLENPTWQ